MTEAVPLHECGLPGVRWAWVDLESTRWPLGSLEAWLTPEEIARAGSFRFALDRHRFVVARAVLRRLLGDQLGIAPEEIPLEASRFGKPRLGVRLASDLAFNLSRTGARAMYAFADGLALGVDAEAVRPLPDMESLARDVFSLPELVEWESLPEVQRLEAFFAGWTRKEAFVKALGRGLDYPLTAFDVSLAPRRLAKLERVAEDAGPVSRWSMDAFRPEDGYVAAIIAGR